MSADHTTWLAIETNVHCQKTRRLLITPLFKAAMVTVQPVELLHEIAPRQPSAARRLEPPPIGSEVFDDLEGALDDPVSTL